MKIALPVSDNKLCLHFGHCEKFEVFDVDDTTKKITATGYLHRPAARARPPAPLARGQRR